MPLVQALSTWCVILTERFNLNHTARNNSLVRRPIFSGLFWKGLVLGLFVSENGALKRQRQSTPPLNTRRFGEEVLLCRAPIHPVKHQPSQIMQASLRHVECKARHCVSLALDSQCQRHLPVMVLRPNKRAALFKSPFTSLYCLEWPFSYIFFCRSFKPFLRYYR